MQISKTTLGILKNFASINQSIVVDPGSELKTISNVKDMFANATVEETFETPFAIYDLNEFLGVIALFEEPEFDFQSDRVIISEGDTVQEYFYADRSVISTPPEKGITLPSVEVETAITKESLGRMKRAAAVNNATDMTFSNEGIFVHDKSVPTSNRFIERKENSGRYDLSISVDKLKFIDEDYDVNICAKGLANFKGSSVEYFVALQPDGSYESE